MTLVAKCEYIHMWVCIYRNNILGEIDLHGWLVTLTLYLQSKTSEIKHVWGDGRSEIV